MIKKNDKNVLFVSDEDLAMSLAIAKARQHTEKFVKALKKPSFTMQNFALKVMLEDENGKEHIWLSQPSYDIEKETFTGFIANNPISVTSVKIGDKISEKKNNISDWMYINRGVLVGGYTIHTLRDSMEEAQRQDFDASVGFRIEKDTEVEGVNAKDIKADFETPAGALKSLENAYQANDLIAALKCKDFSIEATLLYRKEFISMDKTKVEKTIEERAKMLQELFEKSFAEEQFRDFDTAERVMHTSFSNESIAHILEQITFSDGQHKVVNLNTVFTVNGWKVLSPIN